MFFVLKLQFKIYIYCLFSSLQRFCEVSRVHSRDSGLVCAVFDTSQHTTHYRSKTVQSRIFCPHVCGLSHFEDLIRCFSVYPASVTHKENGWTCIDICIHIEVQVSCKQFHCVASFL